VPRCLSTEPTQVFTSGCDPTALMKRPVRSRMRGVVGAGGEKPPATRLCAGHGTRLKGEFIIATRAIMSKSQTQPDGGEGCSVIATVIR